MVWEAAPLGCCPSKEQRAFASSWLPARLSHAHERLWDGWPGAALVQAAPFCSAAGRVLQVKWSHTSPAVATLLQASVGVGRGLEMRIFCSLVCIASMAQLKGQPAEARLLALIAGRCCNSCFDRFANRHE